MTIDLRLSPGGMYDGRKIQELDIDKVDSYRRNPIIADILSRIDNMERHGSGLKRIKEAYADENMMHFFSDQHNFFVTLKKMCFDEQKLQVKGRKLQDEQSKLQDNQTKLQDNQPKLQDDERKLQVIKIRIQVSLKNSNKGNVKNKSTDYLFAIYHEYCENKCFGRSDISKLLHISPDRASQIIKIMLDAKLIEKAKGKVMYKYNFQKSSE
jgi:ATP-dependent DNA helicase RecG